MESKVPVIPITTPQVVIEQPKQSNSLVILLSVLLTIAILSTGYFAYQTQKLVKELQGIRNEELVNTKTASDPTLEPVATNSVSATIDPTANWKTYNNSQSLPVSFKYPSDINISSKSFEGSNNVFLSKNTINIPEAWGGPLTEMEAVFILKNTPNYKSYAERIEALKSGLVPSSIREEVITGGIRGEIFSGKNVPGYMEGLETIVAVFDTSSGPVSFHYFGNAYNNISSKISEEIFRQIMKTVK